MLPLVWNYVTGYKSSGLVGRENPDKICDPHMERRSGVSFEEQRSSLDVLDVYDNNAKIEQLFVLGVFGDSIFTITSLGIFLSSLPILIVRLKTSNIKYEKVNQHRPVTKGR